MIVTVLNADGVPDKVGDTFDPAGVQFMPPHAEVDFAHERRLNIVPVYFTNDYKPENVMGDALLIMDGSKLIADLHLTRPLGIPLYPSVVGKIIEREPDELGKKGRIAKCRITAVALTPEKNMDERIQPILPEPEATLRN